MSSTKSPPSNTDFSNTPFATSRTAHSTSARRQSDAPPNAAASSSQKSSGGHARLTHEQALESLRIFLHSQSSYDVFPVSFRLIVMDSALVVKKAVSSMLQNGKFQCYRRCLSQALAERMSLHSRCRISSTMEFENIVFRRFVESVPLVEPC